MDSQISALQPTTIELENNNIIVNTARYSPWLTGRFVMQLLIQNQHKNVIYAGQLRNSLIK